MPLDMEHIVRAAAEAALEGQASGHAGKESGRGKHKVLTGPRALLIGAGVYTAGRLFARRRGLVENLQQRLEEYESRLFGGDDDYVEQDAAEGEDFESGEPDEEPEDAYEGGGPEDDFDEEDGSEPEDEYDEPEPEDEYDEPEDEDDEPESEDGYDEEPDEETEPARTSSSGARHNGRH